MGGRGQVPGIGWTPPFFTLPRVSKLRALAAFARLVRSLPLTSARFLRLVVAGNWSARPPAPSGAGLPPGAGPAAGSRGGGRAAGLVAPARGAGAQGRMDGGRRSEVRACPPAPPPRLPAVVTLPFPVPLSSGSGPSAHTSGAWCHGGRLTDHRALPSTRPRKTILGSTLRDNAAKCFISRPVLTLSRGQCFVLPQTLHPPSPLTAASDRMTDRQKRT